MGGVLWLAFQRADDDALDVRVGQGARCTAARIIIQTCQTLLHETRPPFTDGCSCYAFSF